ncbi:MAG TPA: hypothetical protein VIL20_04985 [Sandaracinaceae bacterium]
MRRLLALAGALATLASCGASLPPRFVLERDVGSWSYRRYQRVLDVELPIEGNPAVGHTATYVGRASRTSRSVPFTNVFVTVYERPTGLAAEVRRQLRALASYDAEVRAYGGGYVWYLDGGPDDRWALWVSGAHVVKVGAGGGLDRVPEDVVSTYMGLYPSDLDAHGRARPGTLSEGELEERRPASDDPTDDVPGFLRDNAPR